MNNRRPAGAGEVTARRSAGAMARSPAERLEPTRPNGGSRRRRPEREPSSLTPFLRFLNGMLTFVLVLMLIVGGLGLALNAQFDVPGPLSRSKVVVVPKGDGALEIGARLERDGVVSDRRMFVASYVWTKLSAWLTGAKPVQLKAGDFEVNQNASVRQVVEILSEGRTVSYKVTVPEGLTSHQIVERLKADPNLSGEITSVPPEGTLLPETFIVQRGAPRQTVLDSMGAEQRKLVEKLWEARKPDLPLKSLADAITLASIVEKETGRNDERERVAAVFVNRLKRNMRLQSDPTILYGLFGGKVVWGKPILKSEIGQRTAHNTYQIDGLPPTPICNPGRAAIEAVLNPADTKELYFVADGNGGHTFSETLKEHNAGVQRWRSVEKELKARQGDSDTPTTAQPVEKGKGKVLRAAPPAEDKGTPVQPKKLNAVPSNNSGAWSPTTNPSAKKQATQPAQ